MNVNHYHQPLTSTPTHQSTSTIPQISSSLQVSCSSQQELPVGGNPLEEDLQRAAD